MGGVAATEVDSLTGGYRAGAVTVRSPSRGDSMVTLSPGDSMVTPAQSVECSTALAHSSKFLQFVQ